jgi:hypothetical protein
MPSSEERIVDFAKKFYWRKTREIFIFSALALIISFLPLMYALPWASEVLYVKTAMSLACILCIFLSYQIVRVHKGTEFERIGICMLGTFTIWFVGNILTSYSPIRTILRTDILDLTSTSLHFVGYLPIFYVFIYTILAYRHYLKAQELGRIFAVWALLILSPASYLIYTYYLLSRHFILTFLISLFPILDSFLILILLNLLSLYRRVRLELYFLIITAGIFINFLGNLLFIFFDITGTYSTSSLPDSFFLLTYLVFAFGFYTIFRERIVYFTTTPIPEREEEAPPLYTLARGTSYLVLEAVPQKSFQIFCDLVTHGVPGLCIVRLFPEKVKKQWKLEKTPILWLSGAKLENSIAPHDLNKLSFIISEFLKKTKDSAVMVEGIEYLITQNDFFNVLKFLQTIDDLIVVHDSRLIVSANPGILEKKELAHLKRELAVI